MQERWTYVVHWVRVYYGIYLLYSGLRYAFTGFVPEIPGVGGKWAAANADIYIYQFIKYLEIVAGTMILSNRFVLLGLILEMPTTVNVFWLNTFIVATPRQLFTGPHELIANGFLLLAYAGWIYAAVRPKLAPLWLWDHAGAYQAQFQPPQVRTSAHEKAWAVGICLAITAVCFIGTTGLFYTDFRPARARDLTAYAGAWLWLLWMLWRAAPRVARTPGHQPA